MPRIVITGASRGIGLELVRQLTARGDTVIAACRTTTPELDATGATVVDGIDVTDDTAVGRLAAACALGPVDMLINNAGLMTRETLDDLDFARIRAQFEVNTLGPLRVTKALLPALGKGAKVAIVSSRVGSLADNQSGGNYGYRMSKTAVNMAGVNLAHDLKPLGITVVLLHPGYVRTALTRYKGFIDPPESVAGLIARLDAATLEETGTFWHAEGYQLPW